VAPAQPGLAGYIAGWGPPSVSPAGAAFARQVVAGCGPAGAERARNLLRAAGKLADYGAGLGLQPAPGVLLHPSVIERFAAHAPGMSAPARRTLRTNLRFIARAVVPHLDPADAPLPRERAKQPYTCAEIDGYLALADAQPTPGRRWRASALVCLGAGAGLIRSDLRNARGTDITCRSGGVVVQVHGRALRAVPVLARYQPRLLEAAAFAGENFLTGGDKPERGNITNPLTRSLAGGTGLPPLDTSRLRATWLAETAALIGLPASRPPARPASTTHATPPAISSPAPANAAASSPTPQPGRPDQAHQPSVPTAAAHYQRPQRGYTTPSHPSTTLSSASRTPETSRRSTSPGSASRMSDPDVSMKLGEV